MSAVIRIVLADDHSLVRAGLRLLLEGLEGVEVVGEASNGQSALQMIEKLKPTVALLDISMPEMTGLEVLHRLRATQSDVKVLLLSMYDNKEYVTKAIQYGAAGYLIKDAAVNELQFALMTVQRGQTYLSPSISGKLAEAFVSGSTNAQDNNLTTRQVEIVSLVAKGNSSKEIALLLNLSIKTVETHRAQIMERLGIHDVTGLVRYAIRHKLIDNEI